MAFTLPLRTERTSKGPAASGLYWYSAALVSFLEDVLSQGQISHQSVSSSLKSHRRKKKEAGWKEYFKYIENLRSGTDSGSYWQEATEPP